MPAKPLPPAELLRQILSYDPKTGTLTRRSTGRDACSSKGFYSQVFIENRNYSAHRIIWKMVTGDEPPEQIDHWNRDGSDNRWANLRAASATQNQLNRHSPHREGLTRGVYRRPNGKYAAIMWVNGRKTHLGVFDTAEEADRAYLAASMAMGRDFLCTDNVSPHPPKVPKQAPKRSMMEYQPGRDDWLSIKV